MLLLLLVAVVRVVVKARTNSEVLRLRSNQDDKKSMRDPPVLLLFTMVVGIVFCGFRRKIARHKIFIQQRYGKIFRKTCQNWNLLKMHAPFLLTDHSPSVSFRWRREIVIISLMFIRMCGNTSIVVRHHNNTLANHHCNYSILYQSYYNGEDEDKQKIQSEKDERARCHIIIITVVVDNVTISMVSASLCSHCQHSSNYTIISNRKCETYS